MGIRNHQQSAAQLNDSGELLLGEPETAIGQKLL